jgi:hypothetical protein
MSSVNSIVQPADSIVQPVDSMVQPVDNIIVQPVDSIVQPVDNIVVQPVANPYLSKTMEVLARCKIMALEKDWTKVSTVGGIPLLNKKFIESPIPAYRCECTVPSFSHSELVKSVWDVDEKMMKSMESSIDRWEIIEQYPDCRVVRQVNSLGPRMLIWPREVILVQARIVEADQTWFVTHSLDTHPAVPLDKKFVRARIIFNSFGFIQQGENILVSKLTLGDPCGSIPTGIITMFSRKMVKLLDYLKQYALMHSLIVKNHLTASDL